MTKEPCARCGEPTPTIDNVLDVTSKWGVQVSQETETTERRTVRIFGWHIAGRYARGGARTIQADEERPLCVGCGDALIGRFMQGRSVPALPGRGLDAAPATEGDES